MKGYKKVISIGWILVLLMTFSSCGELDKKTEEKVVAIISSAESGDMIVAGNSDDSRYFLAIVMDKTYNGLCWELTVYSPMAFLDYKDINSKNLSLLIGEDGFIYKVPKKNVNTKLKNMFTGI